MYTDNDYIRLDWAAKYVLRDKADFEIFEGLMTVLFGEKVKIVELLESESNRENRNARCNRVDIKATHAGIQRKGKERLPQEEEGQHLP